MVLALVFAALPLLGVEPLERYEDRMYDVVMVPLLPDPPASERITIIEVDERTLSELGQRWPLDRRTWATFFERLARFDPAAVGADVVFDQPWRDDGYAIADEARRRFAATAEADSPAAKKLLAVLDESAREHDADEKLAKALALLGDVTLGVIVANGPTFPNAATPLEPVAPDVGALALDARGVTASTPRLFLAARSHGAMNVLIDGDGIVRRYPYVASYAGDGYASLALALGISDLRHEERDPIVERIVKADGAAPLLRFREVAEGRSPWPRLSFSDVLYAGDDAEELGALLRGRYVLIGVTAPGILDLLRTPVAWGRAGVEVHATALDNLLTGSWLERTGAAAWMTLAMTALLVGGFAVHLGRRPRARMMLLFAGAAIAVELGAAVLLATEADLMVRLVPVPLGIAMLGAGEGLHRWLWSRREQQRMAARERLLQVERAGLERLRAVVEHVGDAIVSVDAEQRINWMNPAAETLFRRHRRSLVDSPVSDLVPSLVRVERSDGGAVKPGIRGAHDVLAGEARVGDQLVPVEATVTPMSVGGQAFTNFVFRDVGARKASERQKDEFIASINHELRTPLTSILGSLRLIGVGAMGELPAEAQELVAIAEKNGERLLALVNDLLDSAKIDAGRLVLDTRPLAVGELMAEARERHGGFGARFGVEIVLVPAPTDVAALRVEVDKERVFQVVGNLVSNAVKHSPPGGRVTLDVAHGQRPGWVRVTVVDQGPGIPEEFRGQVFERFSMSEAGDGKRRPGTGLGLAIARGIVEAHGGEIGFDSEVGHGTTFWFELPCVR